MISAIHRKVVFVTFKNFDLLDLSGPLAAFVDANDLASGQYETLVVSVEGGPVASYAGVSVLTERATSANVDTLVVLGGLRLSVREPEAATLDLIRTLASTARRITSVCTGAFLLAKAGLLDGKRATTHWRFAAEFQSEFPNIRVDADKIFVRDGSTWTAAGVTAGIDLALALIEEDLGLEASRAVARGLVVYHRRLGGQSQYSALLDLEPSSDRIARALSFARDHLHEKLPVGRLAEAANLSERQFTRAFLAETGMSPAKAVERLRAESARPLIEDSRHAMDVISRMVGFSDPERMRQAFMKIYGHPPQALRRTTRANLQAAGHRAPG